MEHRKYIEINSGRIVSYNNSAWEGKSHYALLDFQKLECWKQARSLRIELSELVKGFPKYEKFNLISQIIRSSRSVNANIAEGYGRYHLKDSIRFCILSRGSLVELYDHLIVAFDENYISEITLIEFRKKIEVTAKILNDYIKYLKDRYLSITGKNYDTDKH